MPKSIRLTKLSFPMEMFVFHYFFLHQIVLCTMCTWFALISHRNLISTHVKPWIIVYSIKSTAKMASFSTWLRIKSTFLNDIFHLIESSSLVWILFLLSATDVGFLCLILLCLTLFCSSSLCSAMLFCILLCLVSVWFAQIWFTLQCESSSSDSIKRSSFNNRDYSRMNPFWIHNQTRYFSCIQRAQRDWIGLVWHLQNTLQLYIKLWIHFFFSKESLGISTNFLFICLSVSCTSSTHGWYLNWETLKISHTQQWIMYKQFLVDALNWISVIILIQWRENKTTNTDVFPNIWIFKLFKHLIITQPMYGIYLHRVPYGF